ncbi:MAG: 2-amino-4-hydroxy-6-hydroxymethyldihydropteridine diphosphokinase [Cellvibrionaceae bacterium]|jgi:2-amino-4-hydroxy-6-hydroxymethyldihydropteridine diphosphokinase
MVQAVIGVGSNVEREKNICSALDQLFILFGELSISPVYQSAASVESMSESKRNSSDQQESFYYNLVLAIETDKAILSLKHSLRAIEKNQERNRNVSAVTLDLDVLLYGDWIGELDSNAVPHQDITECAHVLRPLADLLPGSRHPIYNKKYYELWSEFSKNKTVNAVDFFWNDRVISSSGW